MQSNSSAAPRPNPDKGESLAGGAAAEAALTALENRELLFPHGLFGFHDERRFRLRRFDPGDGSRSPFLILESLDRELSFPVIPAESLPLDYRLPADPELLAAFEARSAAELLVLLIATVRDRVEEITVNLQGPVIVNPTTRLGAQWIVEDYPLRQPLLAIHTK